MPPLKDGSVVKGYLLLVISALTASVFVLCYRYVSKTSNPLTTIFLLYIFATSYSVPWFLWNKSWRIKLSKRSWMFILIVCASSLLGNYFHSISLQNVSPSTSQMMQRTDIFFGFAYGVLVFKERITPSIIIGLALCISGLSLMFQEFLSFNLSFIGIISGVLTGFCFATMQFATKFIINSVDPNTINFWRLLISSVFLFFFVGNLQELQIPINTILVAAVAAFLGPFGTRMLINYALNYAPFSAVSLVATIAPVLTFFLQYIFLGIVITPLELLGSLLVLLAVTLVTVLYKG